jgi:hypothetical protein
MILLDIYAWGVMIVFAAALIPCWVSEYQPIEHVYGWIIGGRTMLGNAFAIPIFGTLKASAIAALWPVVVPVLGVLWVLGRR